MARKVRREVEKDEGRRKMEEKRTNKIRTVRDLKVYRKAFDCAMEIFFIFNELTYYCPCHGVIHETEEGTG